MFSCGRDLVDKALSFMIQLNCWKLRIFFLNSLPPKRVFKWDYEYEYSLVRSFLVKFFVSKPNDV